MKKISFSFYGYNLLLNCNSKNHHLLNYLTEDFGYFLNPSKDLIFDCIINIEDDFKNPTLAFIYSYKCRRIFGWSSQRIIKFNNTTEIYTYLDKNIRRAIIKSSNTDNLHEVLKDFILSSTGEHLEKSGWMRLHALGLQKKQQNLVFVMPSKGGKSSLALKHLKNSTEKLFSDEIVFTNGKLIRPFPICIALTKQAASDIPISTLGMRPFKKLIYEQKFLSPIPLDRIADEGPLDTIYAVKYNIISFIWSTFWGLGLPQMAEYLLRPGNIFGLFRIALTRIKVLFLIFLKGKVRFISSQNESIKIKELKHSLKNP